jgi:hypothetical protein
MDKNNQPEDLAGVYARADALQRLGASVEKAAKYLNAEFNMCFYGNKNALWATFMEAGKPQFRKLGVFA